MTVFQVFVINVALKAHQLPIVMINKPKAFIILGNQLFSPIHLKSFKDHHFMMAEDYQLCTYVKHHRQKILLFLSAMRSYADELKKANLTLTYFDCKHELFKNFAVEILKKEPKLNVYGNDYNTADGTCVRDFVHVSDLADIHLKVLFKVSKNNKSIILNCGYGRGFSVLEVVNNFKKFSKNKVLVRFEKRRKAEIVESVANVIKLNKYLKWRPKFFNLSSMIKNSIDWEKKLIK